MVKRGLILSGVLATFCGLTACNNIYAEGLGVSIDVSAVSLQLTVPSSANIVLNPSTSNAFGDAEISFRVATNNPTGYEVIVSVPQTEMIHNTISTANIPTLESSTTEANFPVNRWGYKTTGNYNPIQLSNSDAAWGYDGPTNGRNHSFTIGAKIDNSTPAGTYTNTLVFSATVTPNAPKQQISFDGNGADSGAMSPVAFYGGMPQQLPANQYVKTGYIFNGWNTLSSGLGDGYQDEGTYTSPMFDSQSSIILYAQWILDDGTSTGPAGGRSLVAAYEQAYASNSGNFEGHKGMYVPEKNAQGAYTGRYFEATSESDYEGIPANDLRFAIQDIDLMVDGQKVCERTTVPGSSAHVVDLRDNKSYWVAKLADGKCWMTQNLDYSILTTETLDSTTSDLNQYGAAGYTTETGYTKDANDVIYWTPAYSTFTSIDPTSGTIANWGWEYFVMWERVFDPGDWYWIGSWTKPDGTSTYYGSRYGVTENNYVLGNPGTVFSRTPYQGNMEHGHVGNYYNFAAAIATNDMSYYGGNTFENSAYLPQNSICPKGWRLPDVISETRGDWAGLVQSYPVDDMGDAAYDTAVVAAPIWLIRGGGNSYWNGQFSGGGTNGVYWTTAFTEWMNQIVLRFGPSGVEPYGTGVGKSNTGFIRCIAR